VSRSRQLLWIPTTLSALYSIYLWGGPGFGWISSAQRTGFEKQGADAWGYVDRWETEMELPAKGNVSNFDKVL